MWRSVHAGGITASSGVHVAHGSRYFGGEGLIFFRRHYPELDLVRAVAIALVLMRHFSDLFMKGGDGALASVFSRGWHGVDLFFALSGFLIGGQIIEECRRGDFSFRRFFIKRSLRILPPYFFAIAVFVAYFSYRSGFLIIEDGRVLSDLLAHAFYLQDYVTSSRMMYNGIYWSLAVEEKFYIILPAVIFLVSLVKKGESSCCLLYALGALILLGAAMRFISFDPTREFWSAYMAPFHLRFDSLLVGVLAAFVFIYFRGRLSASWKAGLAAAAFACLSLGFFYGGFSTDYFNVCWQFTLTGVGFSSLILLLVSMDAGKYLPFKKAFSAVSRVSYAMYLYHMLLLGVMHRYFLRELLSWTGGGAAGLLLVFIVYFGGVTVFSMGAYTVVDRPFMNWRRRILKREAGAAGPSKEGIQESL